MDSDVKLVVTSALSSLYNSAQFPRTLRTVHSTVVLFWKAEVDYDVIKECRCFFGITDTKLLIVKRKMKFLRKYCSSENGRCM